MSSSAIAQTSLPAAGSSGRLRSLRELPGPRGLPLLGNALELKPERSHLVLEAWGRQYGPLAVYHFGRQPVLLVSDPALAQLVMRGRPQPFRRMSALDAAFREIIGRSLFTAEGDELTRQRKLWTRALSAQNLHSFLPTLARITERLRRRWLAHARAGNVVDVRRDCMCFAVDAISSLALEADVNTLEGRDEAFQQNVARIFPRLTARLTTPRCYWRWFEAPAERALKAGLQQLRDHFAQAIAAARAMPASTEGPTSFLRALIELRDDDGRGASDDELIANCVLMLVGGEETTGFALAWAIHCLCEQPDLMDPLRAEADVALAAERVPQTPAQAEGLELAGAVAFEVLRVRPPVPVHFLEAACDTELGGVLVPRGTPVQLLARPASEGREALCFEPDRWLSGSAQPVDRAAQFPFGSGPRVCPGRALALLEMRLVIGMLARNFDLSRAGAASEVHRLIMAPQGLRVRLDERPAAGTG
ncbi:MAG TPA: cytochrome P450 [Polyangiaceae bacterium]|nr:cytochrome P450 [Polyangiaceae bacterium]